MANPIPGAGNNNIVAIPVLRVHRLGVGSTAAVLVVGVSAAMPHLVRNGGAVPVAIGVLVGHMGIGVRAGGEPERRGLGERDSREVFEA